jgi:glycosyltransferase involved in cell wall biosynthesis
MHVLHVETGKFLYGGALQVLYLIEGLEKRGLSNTLVCAKGSEIGRAGGQWAKIHEIPMAGELDPRMGVRLLHVIKAVHPDIIHLHSRRGADTWGVIAGRVLGRKIVVTRRVDNPEFPWLARFKYRFCEGVIGISEGIRQVLLSEGIPSGKLTLVPSAVDWRQYEEPCEKRWFSREFGLDPDNRVIGTIAQLIPRKGHRFLIEAAPAILDRFPGTRFLILGRGPLEKELRSLCRRLGVLDRFQFAGFRTDLARILPCLDMVVHPALMEGLGVSLLQAAASGLPIVATRKGGIPEIVKDGVNGYLVEAKSPQAITGAVLSLLGDPEKAHLFGRAGQEIVRTRFSIAAMVEGNHRVYKKLLPGR